MAIWRFIKKKKLGVWLTLAVFVFVIGYIAHLFLTLPAFNPERITFSILLPYQILSQIPPNLTIY